MFWPVLITVLVVYAANTVLAMHQMKNFSTAYSTLRRRGRVAMGKQKNALSSGAIVMFLLDEQGRIVTGSRLTGITVWSRFTEFTAYDGQPVAEIDPRSVKLSASMRRAVANARDNYLTVEAGGVPVEPPAPLMKVINRFDGLIGRRHRDATTAPSPVTTTPPSPVTRRTIRRRSVLATE